MVRVVVTAMLLLATACGASDSGRTSNAGGDGTLRVVASFYPLTEAARRVAGGRADVTNLTPAGTEPHDLELSPRQVDELEDADLVIYLGAGFQPAVERVAARRGGAKVDLSKVLPLDKGEEQGLDLDPHFWLDPALMDMAVERITKAIAEVRPDWREELERNAAAYRGELQQLGDHYASTLSVCRRKELVTSHAAFHYLAKRYGLTQEPIAGLSPEAEPDPKRLASLMDLVRRSGATTVFYETLVSPEVAETLARGTGTQTAVLDPLEGLTGEQLGKGASYVSVMSENLAVIKKALDCG